MLLFKMPGLSSAQLPATFASLTPYFSPALLCLDDLLPLSRPPPAPSPLYLCLVCRAVTVISQVLWF